MGQLNKIVRQAASVVEGGLNAAGAWCGRNSVIVVLTVVIVLIAGAAYVGRPLITHGTSQALAAYDAISDHKEKVEAYGKLVAALGLLAAAPFALLGVALAFWRTWNQHRDGELAARKLDAEAFAKAVEQLGHEKDAVRMGAVLALQNLAEASPRRLLGQTLEILCAYVREKRPWTKEKDEQDAVPLETDIKLILEVISRLNRRNADGKIPVDLSNTDLRGADLSGAYLEEINFSGSILTDTKLNKANLQNANLWKADLRGAYLSNADLQNANLWKADLRGAYLSNANLQDASLGKADLRGTNLSEANLQDASLGKADLQGASLLEANLQGADLSEANLQCTYLWGANLQGADLSGTDLQGAEIYNANLEGAILTGTTLEKKDEAGG